MPDALFIRIRGMDLIKTFSSSRPFNVGLLDWLAELRKTTSKGRGGGGGMGRTVLAWL